MPWIPTSRRMRKWKIPAECQRPTWPRVTASSARHAGPTASLRQHFPALARLHSGPYECLALERGQGCRVLGRAQDSFRVSIAE